MDPSSQQLEKLMKSLDKSSNPLGGSYTIKYTEFEEYKSDITYKGKHYHSAGYTADEAIQNLWIKLSYDLLVDSVNPPLKYYD